MKFTKSLTLFTSTFLLLIMAIIVNSCTNQQPSQTQKATADTLSYETITLINTYQNCEPNTEHCTYISLEYPQFTNASKPLVDSLNATINNFIGANPEGKYTEPAELIELFIQNYATFVSENAGYNIPWTMERSTTVHQQNAKHITLKQSSFSFEGGAHPNSSQYYLVIDKQTGKHLNLTDFFDTVAITKLTMLAEPLFCSLKGIAPNQGMKDAGFDFPNNRFALNDNFYFTNDGITFFYNTYEIGPYVLGQTELTIPAHLIIKLMKK